ncbi:MAG: bifunctional riboflavin kinase/FAD synthetase [Candidatus Tectomicrobia bacterium]|uniref:Riboflavin biosynthesis protein n=1 Tax=Tectimicrobiota bacterium TaxID=2528274 RepID=A0A933LQ46_UNCTE|nr:bifunctional riboflavin kinase/FAD synthetase [Candidatus Tectomicrobia bacterium]
MEIVREVEKVSDKYPNVVLTIGNFDGLHLGHQVLINRVIKRAIELSGTSALITFEPHPLKVLAPEKCPLFLNTFQEKVQMLEIMGLNLLICLDFTTEFAHITSRDFVEEVLVSKLKTKEVFVGHDFRFGQGREGTVDFFKKLGEELGFRAIEVQAIKVDNFTVSSTTLRTLVSQGEVEKAAKLLGRPYSIAGKVVSGEARGRKLGFPTANIQPVHELIPSNGVYAVRAEWQGRIYPGVANLGFRPTFKHNQLSIEVHLFDFSGDLYDQELKVYFIEKLRDEKTFRGVEELIAEINKDVARARKILSV